MGTTWGRRDPGGPHVGPMNFAIWDVLGESKVKTSLRHQLIEQIQIVAQSLWIFPVMDECSKFQCRSSLPKQCPMEASIITSTERRRLCFQLCWFVSLSVCVFVCLLTTLRENQWTNFHEIFRICWERFNEQSDFFFFFWGGGGRGVCLTSCIHGFVLYVFKEIRFCDQHNGKTDGRIFMKFFGKGRTWDNEHSGTFLGSCG